MLRLCARPVACCWICCAKFETRQTFEPKSPHISFVGVITKRSLTMLHPFAQL